ncbi:MAG TPA: hypothetical protein VKZ60_16865 [Chloroflexota bacterium]|nr:hypothetical protein [Chloroflexota bacterium]
MNAPAAHMAHAIRLPLARRQRRGPRAGRPLGVLLALMLAVGLPAPPARAQEGCRVPGDDQIEAGAALEGILLILHGLRDEVVPLDDSISFGDPGPCPGGARDAFRGIDIMGWALEVSGPTAPQYCSPNDPPSYEVPPRFTRCVEPSTTIASRNARVAYGELLTRAPFPLLLPSALPDGLLPHWTTLRVTARRPDAPVPRQYGVIVRYLGEAEVPWLLLLLDTGEEGEWVLDLLRQDGTPMPVRDTEGVAFDGLPEYDGPGSGLLWAENGMRLLLFGPYPAETLAAIAESMEWRPPAAPAPTPPVPDPWREPAP